MFSLEALAVLFLIPFDLRTERQLCKDGSPFPMPLTSPSLAASLGVHVMVCLSPGTRQQPQALSWEWGGWLFGLHSLRKCSPDGSWITLSILNVCVYNLCICIYTCVCIYIRWAFVIWIITLKHSKRYTAWCKKISIVMYLWCQFFPGLSFFILLCRLLKSGVSCWVNHSCSHHSHTAPEQFFLPPFPPLLLVFLLCATVSVLFFSPTFTFCFFSLIFCSMLTNPLFLNTFIFLRHCGFWATHGIL